MTITPGIYLDGLDTGCLLYFTGKIVEDTQDVWFKYSLFNGVDPYNTSLYDNNSCTQSSGRYTPSNLLYKAATLDIAKCEFNRNTYPEYFI